MRIGQRGTRPTVAIWAAFVTLLGVAGCAREEEPAPPPPPPAPPLRLRPRQPLLRTLRDSADPLEHGRYLVETIAGCGNCHTPRLPDGTPDGTKNLAGAFVIEEPVFKAYARNITPDMETGIGSWTEDQIVDAIRNARRPRRHVHGPADVVRLVQAHVGHRRARDRQVREVGAGRSQRGAAEHVLDGTKRPAGEHLRPDRHERARHAEDRHREVRRVPRGPRRPLHGLPHDVRHGPDRHDAARPRRQLYARPFIYDWAAVSANITSHPTAGLGAWTDAEIKRAITEGISRDGRQLLPFMPYWLYKKMAPSDLDAVVAYLRSLPPLGPAAAAPPE